jgi:hypothetical protein
MPVERKPISRIVDITYQAHDKPLYAWQIVAVGEDGQKMIMQKGEGSWVEAMFKAQDLRKALGVGNKNVERKING